MGASEFVQFTGTFLVGSGYKNITEVTHMTGLRFAGSEVRTSKCPRETILRGLAEAKILLQDRLNGVRPIGIEGGRILAAACERTLAIATHHAEGRFDEVVREAEIFLPPVLGPTRGKWNVLLLDVGAILDADETTLLSKAGAMAVLEGAYRNVGRTIDAAHIRSYLREVAHAIQIKAQETARA